MTTPPTGRLRGRPKGAPNKRKRGAREDGYRYALGFAEACQMALGVSAERTYLLATLEFLAKKVEFSGKPSEKMGAILERANVGTIVSYDISCLGGNKDELLNEKRVQGINTLRKKAQRYNSEEDIYYRTVVASIFQLALFEKSDVNLRVACIHQAARMIGEEQMGDALIQAMRLIGEEAAA